MSEKKRLSEETAGICGLFCGTCPHFGEDCLGCLSGKVAPGCDICPHGFRDCAASHDITRCNECTGFESCARLLEFSKKHIVNGICHHAHIFEDLEKMNRIGVQSWVDEQTETHTDPASGKLRLWYDE